MYAATGARQGRRGIIWSQELTPPVPSPGRVPAYQRSASPAAAAAAAVAPWAGGGNHPLSRPAETGRLAAYEERVKGAFDGIVPVLRELSAAQHEQDFPQRAQRLAAERLGIEIPEPLLADAWVAGLDMRRLFAWCVFETFRQVSRAFYRDDPLAGRDTAGMLEQLRGWGYHAVSISPCADGRLAHLVSYALRLPYAAVRRKSYAGALFDVELSVTKWTETELMRFREGVPNTADEPTRSLKIAVYHYSGSDPREGCAAHGHDAAKAAAAALERLQALRAAIENHFCCGASLEILLLGIDTDDDALRVHLPDAAGMPDVSRFLAAADLFEATRGRRPDDALAAVHRAVREAAAAAPAGPPADGMLGFAAHLLAGNLAQIAHTRSLPGGRYADLGHQERFIGVGSGFEEVQLRNLTYFAHMSTVEEGAKDLDVGIGIFERLYVRRALPIPIVVRQEFDGRVPGSRERAIERCRRLDRAIRDRYTRLSEGGLLQTCLSVRDLTAADGVELLPPAWLNGKPGNTNG